jgi:predicted ATPase
LEELPIVEQDVLRRAAVMGVSFPFDGLVALCRKQVGEKEVSAALDEAVHLSFLNRMNNSMYQFNHSLMQETIYETLSYAQRQQWHTQFGDWLVEHQPEGPLEMVAYHYLRGNDGGKAAQFGCRAGDKARRHGVLVGALEYYEQVLVLPGLSDEMKMRAAESRADVLVLQGDYSLAAAAYAELAGTSAAGKKVLLSGDLLQLTETEFDEDLRPWAIGSQAWLLAQTGQTDAACKMVDEALSTTGDKAARSSLLALSQKLSSQQEIGEYREWLKLFARGFWSEK